MNKVKHIQLPEYTKDRARAAEIEATVEEPWTVTIEGTQRDLIILADALRDVPNHVAQHARTEIYHLV